MTGILIRRGDSYTVTETEDNYVMVQEKSGHLQGRERDFRRNQNL